MHAGILSNSAVSILYVRELIEMANNKHKVQFNAHRTVRREVPVKFKTRDGEKVSFEAKKRVEKPVRVKFMAKD